MELLEPGTTVWPVAPGTLGFVAADELFIWGLFGAALGELLAPC